MVSHKCEQFNPNCFRCSLNVDELIDNRDYCDMCHDLAA